MKTCILLLICFTATITSANKNSTKLQQNVTSTEENKIENNASNPDGKCVFDCIGQSIPSFNRIFAIDQNVNMSILNSSTYEPDFLNLFNKSCEAYKKLDKCWGTCPNDLAKQIMIEYVAPLKYMCVEKFKEIGKHLPCVMSNGFEIMKKTCQPKCAAKEKPIVANILNMMDIMNISQHENFTIETIIQQIQPFEEKLWSDSCTLVDCQFGCLKPLIATKCSEEAAELLQDLLKRTVEAVEKQLKIKNDNDKSGIKMQLPKSCKDLQNGVGVIRISIQLLFGMILVFAMKHL